MGELDLHLSGVNGYFEYEREEDFPWSATSKSVWYSLLVVENTQIVKYGFTSAKGQKKNLLEALEKVKSRKGTLLLGVWNGEYSTSLFDLDITIAIEKLKLATR